MKRLQVFCLSLLVAVAAMADITVKGTVTDAETGEALIGVSILVKGTTNGTVSDFDGAYELTVPESSIIQFSYMGYTMVEKSAAAQLNVKMESESTMLNEVVSLGYSSQKKAELSSAVVTVSSEKLTDVTTPDIGNMLQGKVAGVQISNATGQPGAAAEIKIRGTGSITASSSPVYVVDGVMGGSFNPNDVETISVLKDAGATGIYGASAAGGVIVVTTKSGKHATKPTVDLRATVGVDQPLFGNYVMMESQELYDYHKSMYPSSIFKKLRPSNLQDRNYNWRDLFFKNGLTQNYHVALSGGTNKLGYYASFDYYKQDGTLINTGYERFSGRVNLNAEIAKWFDFNVRMNFDKGKTEESASWRILNDAYTKTPWDNPYDVNTGEPVYINSATRPDNGETWYSQDQWNALHTAQYDYARGKDFTYTADLQLNFHITDWLHFTSTERFAYYSGKYESYTDPRTYGADGGSLYNGASFSNSFGTTNILKAAYQWGQHSVNGMVGFEYSKWNSEYTTATGKGMPNGVDALNACTPSAVSGYTVPGASWATFIQAGYDYHKRYFINATFRAESSSIFAPEKRVGYFPSVSASWLISNEEWMKPYRNIVSNFKLRASYGVTGNNNIPEYQYLSTYALSSSYQNVTAAIPTRLANPELHWETANMASVGIDLDLINRINMSIDLYNTDNTGLLLNVPVSPSSGFFQVMRNAGSVRNQGIEFAIDATAIQTKDWRWDIGFNIGFNKNRVTSTPNGEFLQTANNVNQIVREGNDIYSWYMKEWAGVDPQNGDPLWYVVDENENYVLDAAGNKTTTNNYNATNEKIVGKATPLFQGGLNTMVAWRGLSLSINTNFTYGNKVYNYNRMALDGDGAYLGYNQMSIQNSKLGWTRWEKPGDNATHPKAVLNGNQNSNQISSRYLEDGSFFRLKNITLSYDFATLIPKGVNKLRLYLSADNLATATKFSGMDPEVSIYSDTYKLAGMYADQYPVCRNFLVGLEVQF